MGPYDQQIHQLYDERISTLARIKARSLDADLVVLLALRVLVYAQLEGGIKEQVAAVLRHLNSHPLQIGEIAPGILSWRNPDDLNRFKAAVTFANIDAAFPFGNLPAKRVKIRPINRRQEFNQMNSENLNAIYRGLGFDGSNIAPSFSKIDDLVGARNDVAHHGATPKIAAKIMEEQVRSDASIVEGVLTDTALQALSFFSKRLHRR